MNTPIADFIDRYNAQAPLRLHMPGHKGLGALENRLDITEISGADSLYEASGIIRDSEQNAGELFGAHTFYSTEGSSLCIRAMLALVVIWADSKGKKTHILAGRNAHKSFLSAACLLNLEVSWLLPPQEAGYLSCPITPSRLERALEEVKPTALYITSPDYLGNTVDIAAIADLCRRHDVLLIVDNAHGAYLKFLPSTRHPIDLGADLCCDSAHKTLPVLTGGAYLHISKCAPACLADEAKRFLALFGSTSPSYLILRSLDLANRYLADSYRAELQSFVDRLDACKRSLTEKGYLLVGNEPLKITLQTAPLGYTGEELAALLEADGIVPEFFDPDHLVCMLTPTLGRGAIDRLEATLDAIPKKAPRCNVAPPPCSARRVISIREAMLAPAESLPVEQAVGHVLASASVGCPPAVPILVCGEEITPEAVVCFSYYGIKRVSVIRSRKS